ncbi:hypothetical protein EDD11_004647 [Mortierella claussenii]|nr:hypothetical protein EDD11_004647 [Mortierella claussenii]
MSTSQSTDKRQDQTARQALPSTPLSLFFLPPDLVSSLIPKTQTEAFGQDSLLSTADPTTSTSTTTTTATHDLPGASSKATTLDAAVPSCRVCGISHFDSVEKQREHVKLDWHRYNLKQQLLDKLAQPVTELQFENMMQDLSSISGSDTDDSEPDEGSAGGSGNQTPKSRSMKTSLAASRQQQQKRSSTVIQGGGDDQEVLIQSLMKKLELTVKENQRARHQDPVLVHQQQLLEQQLHEARMSPMIWFTSLLLEETVQLGIYKNALPNKGQCDNIVEYLQSLQFHVSPVAKKQKNNKARREARHAVAAIGMEADGDQNKSERQAEQDVSGRPGTSSAMTEKLEQHQGQQQQQQQQQQRQEDHGENDQDDDEQEEEEEKEKVFEPDWIKYQKQGKQLQGGPVKSVHQARYWTLIMIGGGHFAGVVMDLAGQVSSHGRDMKVAAHKTFHRYTVRRKQGGSQASHGIANSAGARIRMYNEEALKLEVRELLEGWSHWIQQSECVFVHSPGNNRRVLFYDNSAISIAERQGRLRSIPFMTRRPTLSELKRTFQELTTVKVSVLNREALEKQEMVEQEALEKAMEASHAKAATENEAGRKDQEKKEKVTPETPPELTKLVELVKKGRTEAMSNHIMKHGIDASQLLPLTTSAEYDIRRTPTLLHLASHHGQAQIVKVLLEKHAADPTITAASATAVQQWTFGQEPEQHQDEGKDPSDSTSLGASSLTAYDIAKDKETRNAFRRAMALLPDTWDWVGQAHVPSALTPEMEAEQERKAKEKTRKVLDAERERKKTREANRSNLPESSSNAAAALKSSLSSPSPSSSSPSLLAKSLASVSAAHSNLSPEMRMRLERERRASAAEARMAAMRQTETIRRAVQEGKNVCVACGESLDGRTPFDKFGRKFCTTDCVAKGPA